MKHILITGGSRGIGKNLVEMLAEEGNQIVFSYYHSKKQAIEIEQKLQEKGFEVFAFQADVSKRNEVEKLVQFAKEKLKTIDVLINNAGIAQTKLFTDITEEDWNQMIATNLTSVFYMTQEVVPCMIQKKKGCIVNISSIWGIVGASCEVHYSAAKAGVDGMTKALAKELGPSNIRVNAIAPGIIDTDMNKEYSKQEIEAIKEEIPLERIGKTVDISKCVKWLIEDEYTTGQVISINGGWSI